MNINRHEIYRYLGYNNRVPDDNICSEIEKAIEEIKELAVPRSCIRYESIRTDAENVIDIASMHIQSRNLYKNLDGCFEVCMFAATIGIEIDRKIKRFEVVKMSKAAIYQAVSAAYVEAYCNELNDVIDEKAEQRGYRTKPRFSPGYGDFSLSHQKEFLSLLNAGREIGITLTEGNLMIPSKSVTAVIGIYKE